MKIYQKVFNKACIIAAARDQRPFISQESKVCPFCLGNEKDLEKIIDEHWEEGNLLIRIIPNRYPITSEGGTSGTHDVIIDTHSHTLHPKDFTYRHWEVLLHTMQKRWQSLMTDPDIRFIQVFKNHGETAGASIAHSHWQLVALKSLPYTMKMQYEAYTHLANDLCYLCHHQEEGHLIFKDELWAVWIPPIPQFPYEVWLVPVVHHQHYGKLSLMEIKALGQHMKNILRTYEELAPGYAFNICFMSGDLKESDSYHFHIKLMLRTGKIAGFEIATGCHILSTEPILYAHQIEKILKGMY